MIAPRTGSEAVDGQSLQGCIGVNLTWLVPGVVGGSEEYSVRLLLGLDGFVPAGVSVRLYGRPDLFASYPELSTNFEAVTMAKSPTSRVQRVALEQTWLRDVSSDDDVVHHMGGTVPILQPRHDQRQVLTIHDLQPLEMPSNFSWAKRTWLGQLIPRSARTADHIVCPSRFTARRVEELLDVETARITVVHHGFESPDEDGETSQIGLERRRSTPTQTRLMGKSFVLYPAIAYKHKRHIDIVEAMIKAGSSLDHIHVVFTGRRGPESELLGRRIGEADLGPRFHVLGRVPEPELDWLYRNAVALVFPSGYEGFGNPALEAMSRGCPVVASSAGALPEVIGDAGLTFPAGDVDGLISCLNIILTNSQKVAAMVSAGERQARRFTPEIASGRLWSVYRGLLTAASGELHRRS